MTDERKGHTSASQAEYDLLCPGRHLAQRQLPDVKSEDAESGTRIHAWLAGNTAVTLSDDEREIAEICSLRATEILDEWKGDAIKYSLRIEDRLWMAFGNFKHSGQPDLVALLDDKDRALVLDYKTGRSEVAEPNTNQQLRDLACLVSLAWPVTEVTVSIVQPFAKRQPPCVYTEEDLQRAKVDLRHRVEMSNNPMAPRIAGETQCKWCKAKRTCPEYDEWTKGALPVLSSGLGIQTPWTPEQWVNFLTIAPEAEKWIEAKRNEARALLTENPSAIPGYELKTIERKKIINVQAVFNQAVNRGVQSDELMKHVTMPKKGLKESLRTIGLKGKELESTMGEIIFGNVETKSTEPMIVRKKE